MSKFDFVHLHNHTEYSLLDGMISLDTKEKKEHNLFTALKKNNMDAVAITDHGNMFGAVEFYKRCKEKDNKIKPIIGSEFYIAPGSRFDKNPQKGNSHIVLLAKSNEGYKNLIQLSSISYTEGFYYNPRIDRELLEKYSEGLVCLSACIAGEIPRLILEGKIDEAEKKALYYRDLFGKDSFFLEMQIHGIKEEKIVAKALYQMSIKLQIPLVATNDCHYLEREDAEAHDILLCIGTKNKFSDQKRLKFHGTDFYFKSEEEMYRLFKDIPKALSNTRVIADMCSVDIKLGNPILPDFEVPRGYSKESYLKELSENGLKKRYYNPDQNLVDRLDMEIDVINRMGFAGYFLIVWDFINYAKTNNIWVGPGRGSGAGSIVAYSLGITNIDPIKYDLIFERFLNEKRVSMPDFDIDFCQERRQEVIDYVVQKYTKEKVSQIVTFSKMKAKAVIKDVGRVLDVPLSRVNQITKYITEGKDLKKEIMETPELKEIFFNGTENEKKLLNSSIKLEKLSRHTSVHAAGVVIGKSAITDFVPLQIVKDKINKGGDIITTQYPGPQLEECGLVKMDFLGLITLTLMRNCIQLLEDKGIILDINNIPLDDQKVFELFTKGDVEAVFQFESPGMKKYLMKLRPNCLEDLIAMNALYRPGPMDQIETYIKRKHLEEKVEYDHPLVEPVLKETYGIMIYQEQVMKISQVVAGYDLGSADLLRRAMGKKKIDEMLKNKRIFVYGNEEERNKVIDENKQLSLENKKPKEIPPVIPGAIKNGLDEKTATIIFEKMEKFAEYGFNKSHAAAYAYVAYQTAYLKSYYPIEFMASVLNSEVGKPDKLKYYIQSLKELNIELLPPDVNHSQKAFSVEDGKIRYALYGIKGVGDSAADNIVHSRREKGKYTDYNDFLRSLDLRIVNKGVLEALILSGALDSLKKSRKFMMETLNDSIKEAINFQTDKRIGQIGLFEEASEDNNAEYPNEEAEWDMTEKLKKEREILGFYLSGNPLDPYIRIIKRTGSHNIKSLRKINLVVEEGKYSSQIKISIVGIVTEISVFNGENNKKWAKIKIEDLYGDIEAFVYGDKVDNIINNIELYKIVVLKGVYRMLQNGNKSLIADSMEGIEKTIEQDISEFHIYLKDKKLIEDELISFKNTLLNLHGSLSLYFHIKSKENKEYIVYSSDIKAPNDKEFYSKFQQKYNFIEKIRVL